MKEKTTSILANLVTSLKEEIASKENVDCIECEYKECCTRIDTPCKKQLLQAISIINLMLERELWHFKPSKKKRSVRISLKKGS